MLPPNTPDILRAHGLKVRVVPGWKKRGRPGSFNPVGVLCHHTATRKTSAFRDVLRLLVRGRSDLPGPLAQFGLTRNGTVWLIAAGRCNHAGKARSSGTVAAGDGNTLYIGIEAFNDGRGEPWNQVQYNAYVLLAAVLSVAITKNSVNTVRGHKETSVTGKIDPTFDMAVFRMNVLQKMNDIVSPVLLEMTRGKEVETAIAALERAKGTGRRKQLIAWALRFLRMIPEFEVKRR